MTREQLDAILSTGTEWGSHYGFTGGNTQQMEEIKALARRGLEAEEALRRCAAATLRMHELHRACELAREYRRYEIWFDGGCQGDFVFAPGVVERLDAALAAVGMPVEEE